MRKAAVILVGLSVIAAILVGVAWRNTPAIPTVEAPPDVVDDDDRYVDDTLLNPEPVGEKDPLDLFKEPSLWDPSTGHTETYRFILMPSFDHPVLVKLWRDTDGAKLITKFLSGKGGYDRGRLSRLSGEI